MQKSKEVVKRFYDAMQTVGDLELFTYHAYYVHFRMRKERQGIDMPTVGYYHKLLKYKGIPMRWYDDLQYIMIDHIIMVTSSIGIGASSKARKYVVEGDPRGLSVQNVKDNAPQEVKVEVQEYIDFYPEGIETYNQQRATRPLFRENLLQSVERGELESNWELKLPYIHTDMFDEKRVVYNYGVIACLSDIIRYVQVKYEDYLSASIDLSKDIALDKNTYYLEGQARSYLKGIYKDRIEDLAHIIKNIKSKEVVIPGDGTGIGTILCTMLNKKCYSGDSSPIMVKICADLGIHIEKEDAQKTLARGTGVVLISHLMEFTPNLIKNNWDRDFIVYEQNRIFKGCVDMLEWPGKQGYLRVTKYSLLRNIPYILSLESRKAVKMKSVSLSVLNATRNIGLIGAGSYMALRYITTITDNLPNVSIYDESYKKDVISSYIMDLGFREVPIEEVEVVIVYDWRQGEHIYNCPYYKIYDGNTHECHNSTSSEQLYFSAPFNGAGIYDRAIERKSKKRYVTVKREKKLYYVGEFIVPPNKERHVKRGYIRTMNGIVSFIYFKRSGTYSVSLMRRPQHDYQREINAQIFGSKSGDLCDITVVVEMNKKDTSKEEYSFQNKVHTINYTKTLERELEKGINREDRDHRTYPT